jgi:hypothetical protein
MTHEAAKQCAKNPQGEELMETKVARLVMGTERNFWEFHTRKKAANAIQLALKQESENLPNIRGLCDNHQWRNYTRTIQRARSQTVAPLLEWAADPNYNEWAKFYRNSVSSLPLFRLKNNKRIATTHLVSHWSEVSDNATDLKEATGRELDTEDEEERDEQTERSGL